MSFLLRAVSLSPILQLVKDRSRANARFFTSTPRSNHPRPYPHRRFQSNRKPPFLGVLDRLSENAVFWGIITINGVVFVMWTLSSQRMKQERDPTSYRWMMDNFTQSWRNVSSGRIWTLVTATFSHENVGHILFNGFTFFFMAKPVLTLLGPRQFLFLYLGGGLFASLSSMGWNLGIKHRDSSSYGASGAIYSVVSFLACVAPTLTFRLYGIIPIPAWLAVTGIFAYDTYSAINDKQRGTDTAGHVGGLVAGMGYFLSRRLLRF
ncbi:hypothetical protein DXG03_003456 [Asterophora parasitica]|uniref:Peptidase S54 rhomboid domain-containing protein n=1 Tax=Asterophora parasitica TaxID=117018 RepID=A0A9P7KC35_9AGAR|nr:hypothetical protein DXG03_003456 [Asterophora parasitica]